VQDYGFCDGSTPHVSTMNVGLAQAHPITALHYRNW